MADPLVGVNCNTPATWGLNGKRALESRMLH
jgi:hypothetical protein